MIQLLTKEYFDKKVKDTEYELVSVNIENTQLGEEIEKSDGLIYFFIPDYGYFMYFDNIPKVAIPKNNIKPINVQEQIIQGELDYSHWEIRRQLPNDYYTINEIFRIGIGRKRLSKYSLPKNIVDNIPTDTTWELFNTVTEETIRFNLRYQKNYLGENYQVVVPQVLNVPYNYTNCYTRIALIIHILLNHSQEIKWIN